MNDGFLKNQSRPCYTGKIFHAAGRHYFFNTVAGSIDALSENAASVLAAYCNNHGGCDVPRADPAAEDLRPYIKNPYSHAEIEATLDRKLRLLVLELTRSCNMACSYCIDGDAYDQKDCLGSANMSEDVALRGVDYLLEHSTDQMHPLAISFYGGEPLLRFELLKKVVEYAEKRADEKSKCIVFSITTNGTLLTPSVAEFLISHSVQMVVSLDGPRDIHDRCRRFKGGGGTFEVVATALEMVRNLDPDYFDRLVRCSVVVTPGSDLEELQAYFSDLHVNTIANFVDTYGIDETEFGSVGAVAGLSTLRTQMAARLREEGAEFLSQNNMSKDFAAVLLSPMIKRFLESDASSPRMSLGQCVLGASRLYLSADHAFYPCEKVAGHSFARIGNIEAGIDADRVADLVEQFYEMAKKQCSGCWMSSRCSACIALACSGDQFDMKKYGHYCRGTKAWGESALKLAISAKPHLSERLNICSE
jgi:uncharacterized protein